MRGDEFFVQVSRKPPFTKLHPRVAGYFREYFTKEKVIPFGDRFVVNTNFPPYPSRAFDQLTDGFRSLGDAVQRRLYSVTLAVTNRCPYRCWHCYNAGRNQTDVPLEIWRHLAPDLQDFGAVMVTLTGGEPLLRDDLEEIVGRFDDRSCLVLGTTGAGLTSERARALRRCGLFAIGISLDSAEEAAHDQLRGHAGAFQTAIRGMAIARANDLYGYVVAVATREFLEPSHFRRFMRFAGDIGALEVHLLEPSATGNLAGRTDVLLGEPEKRQILDYQSQVAEDDTLPILSSYAYLEGADTFGCGAGLTHLYIDGSGEVSPCQLVPLSFGNVTCRSLSQILEQMGSHFRKPRTTCVGRALAGHLPQGPCPLPPEISAEVCQRCLPREHPLPRFFAIHSESQGEVGRDELRMAYDRIHDDYDAFWLVEAAGPIDELMKGLAGGPYVSAFEAGCGTGYATAQLAGLAQTVVAVDISEGMISEGRRRLQARRIENVRWLVGDALETLDRTGPFDLVFTSWVLGYIPLSPFFASVGRRLTSGGRLAFVVHRENSPREPLEIFAELVARDPTVLRKRVAFDFPGNKDRVEAEMTAAGLEVESIREDAIAFRYQKAEEVLDHLLKSGAGTAFYDAIDTNHRDRLTQEFLAMVAVRQHCSRGYEVRHEYVACIARKR